MTAFVVHANLDCEAIWAGAPLPPAVARRASYYAALLAALAPEGAEVEVWAPAAVDPGRLLSPPPWRAPVMRVGTPPRADARWADPGARAANDRRLALAVAEAHGAALPGQKTIASAAEIDLPGPWVCKAPWTAAGRDRCRGAGAPTAEQRTRIERLIARSGALVLEPWCARIVDVGVCARVEADGAVTAHPPHGLIADARGGFLGIDLAPPALEPEEQGQLSELVTAAGAALAGLGHAGPFAIDAFAYQDGERRRFRPLCEINARLSFGWIARALADRLGTRQLGFGPPPPGATVLIAPAGDGITAWSA
ncbi:MAG TPA: hypothetical protein VK932_28040 [Kofleriaceae bacterium]|nr:hypothetical protein [Kofleriaceae bacterium]